MSISAINGYSPVSFTAAPAKAPAKADKKSNIAKTVALVGLGLTAAALTTVAIIRGKQAKAAKAAEAAKQFIPGSWTPKKNIGAEMEQFNNEVRHAINLQRTTDLNKQIAEVEARIAKSTESHDELQKMYEGLFKAAEDAANNAA